MVAQLPAMTSLPAMTATLAIDGAEAATGKAHYDLPGEAKLSRELLLLPAGEYPPGEPKDAVGGETGESD